MSALEILFEELKSLPPDKLEAAAHYVHLLREQDHNDREVILKKVFSSLSDDEVDEWEDAVKTCRKVDAEAW